MQGNDRFWKLIALAGVGSLLYVGSSLRLIATGGDAPGLARSANAQTLVTGTTVDGLDTLITHSPDGQILYLWAFERWDHDRNRLPVYRGTVEVEE